MPRNLIIVHSEQANYCTDVRFLWPAMQTTNPTHCSHLVQLREIPISPNDHETLSVVHSIVIQRPVNQAWKNIIAYYTNLRSKYHFNIVVEFDDAMWEPYDSCDDVMKYVKDGVDFCTVTTKSLKKEIEKRYGIKTIVVPNAAADNLIHPCKVYDKVILYGGAGGHSQDWNDEWKKAINTLIDEGWAFYSAANKIEGIERGLTYPFVEAVNFGAEIAKLPAGVYVAPLTKDYIINAYKSNLKYLEASAMEIPFVGSTLPGDGPYNGIPTDQQVPQDATSDQIADTIRNAYNNRQSIIESQRDYLARKHLRMTDPEFLRRWIDSYANGEQQHNW